MASQDSRPFNKTPITPHIEMLLDLRPEQLNEMSKEELATHVVTLQKFTQEMETNDRRAASQKGKAGASKHAAMSLGNGEAAMGNPSVEVERSTVDKLHPAGKQSKPSKSKERCPVCKKIMSSKKLEMHIQTVHNSAAFHCSVCAQTFGSQAKLRYHEQEHATFHCSVCAQTFGSQAKLRYHEQEHDEDKLSCELCGAEPRNQEAYRKHLATVHNVTKHEPCQK